MQIKPFEELEAAAKKRYKAAYASVPEPTIINLEALVQFTAPVREFQVGGIGLRAPPLLFDLGVRLMVAANALKACREKQPTHVPAVSRTAVTLIRQAVRPSGFRRFLGGWVKTLRQLSSEDVETMLRYLLYVPDESVFPPPTKPGTHDFIDAVMNVIREFPALVDQRRRFLWWTFGTGLPLMWADYVYASRHLVRVRSRNTLMAAEAAREGVNADKKEWERFNRDTLPFTGWN